MDSSTGSTAIDNINDPSPFVLPTLQGKVAIVTGSSHGIGRATAELLTALGARVVLNGVDPDAAAQAAGEIGGETAVLVGNVMHDDVPERLVATAIDTFGSVDIIVNNAGYPVDAPAHKMSDDDFREMLELHTVAPFRLIRAAAPHMREAAKRERAEDKEIFRKIVNITSFAWFGNPGQAGYSAGKSALVGLTRTMAKEWGPLKINVNGLAIGIVETRLNAERTGDGKATVGGRRVQVGIPKEMRDVAMTLIPIGRAGTPQEAAGAIAFFCSHWSDYVTGQILAVGGGLGLGMGP